MLNIIGYIYIILQKINLQEKYLRNENSFKKKCTSAEK